MLDKSTWELPREQVLLPPKFLEDPKEKAWISESKTYKTSWRGTTNVLAGICQINNTTYILCILKQFIDVNVFRYLLHSFI